MTQLFALSAEDVRVMQEAITRLNREVRNTSQRGRDGAIDDEEMSAQDIYIAFTPVGGIQEYTGVSVIGEPCDIYKLVPFGAGGTNYMLEATGFQRTVRNLWNSDIPENTFCLVVKDKFGHFFVAMTFNGLTGSIGPFYKYECSGGSLVQYVSLGFGVQRGLVVTALSSYA